MSLLLKDKEKIKEFYGLVNKSKGVLKIGFDSCSISGVVKYVNVNSEFYEGCDAGRFSAFIDENLRMNSMLDIWQNNSFFKKYRNNILNNGCTSCAFQKTCMGGCPFIDELSQCDWKDERLGFSFPQTQNS